MSDRAETGPSGEEKPLRQRVDELEATVRGLTQELVETTERLRELEAKVDEEADSADDVNTGTVEGTDTQAETDADADDASDDGEDPTDHDDIIVA